MTTIILTIIGILLAAAAALMVIFYGGDAFNGGSIGAQANTYQNAGTNVISAVQLAKADNNWSSASTLTTLQGAGAGADDNYLKETPTVPSGASYTLVDGQKFTAAVSDLKVCARVNKNLKRAAGLTVDTLESAEAANSKMGCYKSGTAGVFYANA